MSSDRKTGVLGPEELKAFIQQAGERLVVIDVRNPDSSVEPGDVKSIAVGPLPDPPSIRPKALLLTYDRANNTMPLPTNLDKDTPIITHCGGGGRGQLAKEFLEKAGFANVVNGGGPKETENWALFGEN